MIALLSIISSAAVGVLILRHLPRIPGEFAYLLASQTFARFALTDPPHPLAEFSEAPHTLAQPTYMAKYQPGQSLAMAAKRTTLGESIFLSWPLPPAAPNPRRDCLFLRPTQTSRHERVAAVFHA